MCYSLFFKHCNDTNDMIVFTIRKLLLGLLVCLTSCDAPHEESSTIDIISGRVEKIPFWRIMRPSSWHVLPSPDNLLDTRLPIQEYEIEDIAFYIHSFPSQSEEARIPPFAQIQRWKMQFDADPPPEFYLERQAFSGYSGILLDGRGKIKGQNTRMLAWALALSPRSYHALKNPEARSDITLKAIGNTFSMDAHEDDIRKSARTFELIEAIP